MFDFSQSPDEVVVMVVVVVIIVLEIVNQTLLLNVTNAHKTQAEFSENDSAENIIKNA